MVDAEFDNEQVVDRKICKILRVRNDSHGMFRAIAFSLALGKLSVQQESRSIYSLREMVAKELLNSCEEPYMSDGTTVKQIMIKLSKLKVEEVGLVNVVSDYYRSMLFRGKPGPLELWGLSRALKRTITVYEKVVLDQAQKKFASYFKHSATYGTNFENEVLLYKNGKGMYACLLVDIGTKRKKQPLIASLTLERDSAEKSPEDLKQKSVRKRQLFLDRVGESGKGNKPLRLEKKVPSKNENEELPSTEKDV